MAKRGPKPKTAPNPPDPLGFDINHHGAREIFCAAIAGISAQIPPGFPHAAAVAVNFADQVCQEVARRTAEPPKGKP